MKQVHIFLLIFVFCTGAVVSYGQEEPSPSDFTLKAVSDFAEVALGSTYVVHVLLSSDVPGIEGWSFGMCINESLQEIVEAVPGKDLNFVNFGSPPEYQQINILPDEGVTEAVILDLQGASAIGIIPEDEPIEILDITLKPDSSSSGLTLTIPFCSTIGTPAVETLVVVGNEGYEPAQLIPSSIDVVRDPPTLTAFQKDTYNLPINNGGTEPVIRIRSLFKLYGFSFGLAHDTDLLELDSAEFLSSLAESMDGREPDFKVLNLLPSGLTAGVVFDTTGVEPDDLLYFQSDTVNPSTPIIGTYYVAGPGAAAAVAASDTGIVSTELFFTGGLGDPKVDVLFTLEDEPEHVPNTRSCEILLTEEALEINFLRGDINADGRHSITDAVKFLHYLFGGSLPYNCREALDCNDDSVLNANGEIISGGINIADAVFLLQFLFAGGEILSAPYPECGMIPADEHNLGCLSFPGCAR